MITSLLTHSSGYMGDRKPREPIMVAFFKLWSLYPVYLLLPKFQNDFMIGCSVISRNSVVFWGEWQGKFNLCHYILEQEFFPSVMEYISAEYQITNWAFVFFSTLKCCNTFFWLALFLIRNMVLSLFVLLYKISFFLKLLFQFYLYQCFLTT